jgi:hypothetical protein
VTTDDEGTARSRGGANVAVAATAATIIALIARPRAPHAHKLCVLAQRLGRNVLHRLYVVHVQVASCVHPKRARRRQEQHRQQQLDRGGIGRRLRVWRARADAQQLPAAHK